MFSPFLYNEKNKGQSYPCSRSDVLWTNLWTWQKIDQEEETVWETIRDSGGQDEALKLHPNDSLREEMGTFVLPGKKRARAGRGRSTGRGAGTGCGRWSRRSPGAKRPCTQRAAGTSAEVTDSGKAGNPAGELGTPREFWAASPGVRTDQKVNVSELSLPEFWGISCGKPRAKDQGTQTCTETAACCSPRNRRPESGRRPVPPSLLLPLPLTPFPAIFLATSCITCLSPLSFSDPSTNSPRKSTFLCLSNEEDPQTLENGLSGFLPYYQTKHRFCF